MLVHATASGLKLNTEFRKVLYWDPDYSNIFINDLFFVIEKSDIYNFEDDNT